MVISTASLVSAAKRPLRVRARPDLVSRRHQYQGAPYWVVKEPLGLNYFRFQEQEFAILEMLDGRTSLEGIQQHFQKRFPPERIKLDEIARFIGQLYQSGLVMADAKGQGEQLLHQAEEKRRRRWLGSLGSILSLRLKGVDPDRLLTVIYPKLGWLFHRPAVIGFGLLAATALTLVTVQFDLFARKLPAFHEFFAAGNWIWLAVVLAVTKILHEFGHGLSCKHFGGECHEMGLMFLVFTPCLYCNVSDSWMLPNKWHRAAIGAAGMYVEIILASIATLLWWFTAPGLLNMLCLNVMFVCSVSTVVFNGNPLLRFDGYYILSDLMEIPNLRQKSGTIVSRKLGAWCLGLEEPEDPFLPQRDHGFFAAYTVAAVVYRWMIVLGILWFLQKVLEPYGLKIVGQALAILVLTGLIGAPVWRLIQYFGVPGRWQKVDRMRFLTSLSVMAAVLLAVVLVPLPHYVTCSFEVKPHQAAKVYIELPGRIERLHVRPGQKVTAGQVLAELSNSDAHVRVAQLQGQRDSHQARIESLLRERFRNEDAIGQLPQAEKALETIEAQLAQRREDIEKLTIKSPVAGTVLPPPLVPEQPGEDSLSAWSGSPLDPNNLGALLSESTLLCQIGDPRRLEAVLVIDQSEVEMIRKGQRVKLLLDQQPVRVIKSEVAEVAYHDMKESPVRLSTKVQGDLPTRTDASGRERLLSTSYQARALLSDESGLLRIGLRGKARIATDWQTLGSRVYRYLCRTFQFNL